MVCSIVQQPPLLFVVKFFLFACDMMHEFVYMLEDIGDIGTIPQEIEDELDEKYHRMECDAELMRSWGCVVGTREQFNRVLPGECPISHNTFTDTMTIAITRCSHAFEYEALREWFTMSRIQRCPLCRNRMVTTG
jgi:hypothetical protein